MKTGLAVVLTTLIVVGLIAMSFFAATWLAMLLAGSVGHIADSAWLRGLSFWECSPVWVATVLIRFLVR